MFYFGQAFVFWRLINKNTLEWFLLIMPKNHTLTRSATLFSRNHPTLCFWLRRQCGKMPNTEQLLHQTDKNCHRKCSIKKLFLKILQYSQKTPALESLFNKVVCRLVCIFIRKRLQHRCFPAAKFFKKI